MQRHFIILIIQLFIFMQYLGAQDIEYDFRNPPQSAKTQSWWHWVNGNISKKGITKDLEEMKKQGIGGATILNIGRPEIQYGAIKFMDANWQRLFKHAIVEADRLGMEVGLNNSDGFSSSGGPWVTPEHAMKKIVWTKTLFLKPTSRSTHLDTVLMD